jgi:hypothetical protein
MRNVSVAIAVEGIYYTDNEERMVAEKAHFMSIQKSHIHTFFSSTVNLYRVD